MAYEAATAELKPGRFAWPVDDAGRAVLNFPRNRNPVQSIPFHALALAAMGAPATPPDTAWLKDKTVFIGSTAVQTDNVHTRRWLPRPGCGRS